MGQIFLNNLILYPRLHYHFKQYSEIIIIKFSFEPYKRIILKFPTYIRLDKWIRSLLLVKNKGEMEHGTLGVQLFWPFKKIMMLLPPSFELATK